MDKTNIDKDLDTSVALKSLSVFAVSTITTTLINFGIRLLKNVVFTRLLGPVERGIFGLLTTIPELIISFGNIGFGLGSTYLIAKRRYDLKKIVGNLLFVACLLGLCLTGIGYIILTREGILKGDSATIKLYAPFVLLAIPFILMERFGTDILVAIKRIHFRNILQLISSGLPVVLIIPLWLYTGETLKSAIYAWAVTIVVVSLWVMIKNISKDSFPFKISLTYLKEGFSFGSRGYISIVANALVRRIDILFISHMLGAQALGYYVVSVSIAEILLAIPDAINLPFLPIRLGLYSESARNITPIVIRYVTFMMLLICLCVAIGGELIISILFGKDFMPAYSAMVLLLPGILALSIYGFLKADMYSYNLPGFVSWASVIALIYNLLLNYLLIPLYGINGAAMSSSISYGLSTLILLIKFIRLSGNSCRDVLIIKKSDLALLWNKIRYSRNS